MQLSTKDKTIGKDALQDSSILSEFTLLTNTFLTQAKIPY